MSNADQQGSGALSGSAASSDEAQISAPKSTHSRESIRAAYHQAVEESREGSRKRDTEKQQAAQQGGDAPSPLALGSVITSASLQDGGPVAPDFRDFIGKFEKDHAEIQQQLKSLHDKQEADDQQARNVAAGLQAFYDAWAVGSAKGDAIMSAIQANIAFDAAGRDMKRDQDAAVATEARRVERAAYEEERRRNGGMSL